MSHARPAAGSRPVHEIAIRRLRIPTRDGVRLFATAWHPDGDGPFPVIINYDPYRSADARMKTTASRPWPSRPETGAPSAPGATPLTAADLPVVIDQVVRDIDRRVIAARERRGWTS